MGDENDYEKGGNEGNFPSTEIFEDDVGGEGRGCPDGDEEEL